MSPLRTPEPSLMAAPAGASFETVIHSSGLDLSRPMSATGFWNNLPLEEERIHLPPMKPHYGRNEVHFSTFGWIDIGELAIFLGILYTTIGCTHLAIMLMDWTY